MKKGFILAFGIILILPSLVPAVRIAVPGDQPTIQAAVEAASHGDTVLVAPGRYYENVNFRGKGIVLASHFILDGNPALVESTIIDGSQPQHPDSASCLLLYRSLPADSVDTMAAVVGFTITGGRGTVWPDKYVPGTSCVEGGGILIENWSPRIYHNRIIGNQALLKPGCFDGAGGGIKCTDGHPRICQNLIAFNKTSDHAGGVLLWHAGGCLMNNVIAYNVCGGNYGGGGGICLDYADSGTELVNNTIVFNRAEPNNGGGIHSWNCNPAITNCIIWGNEGQQILVQGGNPAISCSDIQGGFAGLGNINSDPLFLDDELHLDSTSPCVDSGNDSTHYNDIEDPAHVGQALWPSRGLLRNDMGAYGGPLAWDGFQNWPPFIKGTSPANGQMRVEYDQELIVYFSHQMDTARVHCRLGNAGLALYKSWSENLDSLWLYHPTPFANFTKYWLVIDSAFNLDGHKLMPVTDSIWFKTRDTVCPKLLVTQPYHGQTGVATNALIRLWFSKAVNKNTLTYTFSDTSYHFTLYQTNDSVITLGHVGHNFAGGTTYTLEITSFQDSVGNAMGQSMVPNPFSFTTVGTGVGEEPNEFSRSANGILLSPNPLSNMDRLNLDIMLDGDGSLTLQVFDIRGARVASVFEGNMKKGRHRLIWAPRDEAGRPLSPGCYFMMAKGDLFSKVSRIVIYR